MSADAASELEVVRVLNNNAILATDRVGGQVISDAASTTAGTWATPSTRRGVQQVRVPVEPSSCG